jgi:hypothetical protein
MRVSGLSYLPGDDWQVTSSTAIQMDVNWLGQLSSRSLSLTGGHIVISSNHYKSIESGAGGNHA